MTGARRIESFGFEPGFVLAGKYRVIALLGRGWEAEVYKIAELGTGIERAAKLFFPYRNRRNVAARRHALKLHKLRNCPILIQYHTQDVVQHQGQRVAVLVSEFVEGELLEHWIERQPGQALHPFEALHLLHTLASGIADIHRAREYHGDLHTENVIVRRHGLGYQIKLIDPYQWRAPRHENIQSDVCDLVRLFYDMLGGRRRYSRQRQEIKAICCGLKRSLILGKFKTAGQLRDYLENMRWA